MAGDYLHGQCLSGHHYAIPMLSGTYTHNQSRSQQEYHNQLMYPYGSN
jgi:hypothetical protein